MTRTKSKRKKATKSQRSQSTRKSSAYTPTSSPGALRSRRARAQKLATELYSRSLQPKPSHTLQEAVVEGVSMWPTLRPGFRVRYRSVSPDTLNPGDMLVLRSIGRKGDRHWRVHRLIGRVGPYFVEAGDNAFSAALVLPEDILGRVESVHDLKGKALKMKRPRELDARFRYFLWCAHAFMFAHECKDRLLGNRRSLLLWRISQIYRAGLGTMGLKVPAIRPE